MSKKCRLEVSAIFAKIQKSYKVAGYKVAGYRQGCRNLGDGHSNGKNDARQRLLEVHVCQTQQDVHVWILVHVCVKYAFMCVDLHSCVDLRSCVDLCSCVDMRSYVYVKKKSVDSCLFMCV